MKFPKARHNWYRTIFLGDPNCLLSSSWRPPPHLPGVGCRGLGKGMYGEEVSPCFGNFWYYWRCWVCSMVLYFETFETINVQHFPTFVFPSGVFFLWRLSKKRLSIQQWVAPPLWIAGPPDYTITIVLMYIQPSTKSDSQRLYVAAAFSHIYILTLFWCYSYELGVNL